MTKQLLISDNPKARDVSKNFYPRIIISRKDIKDIDPVDVCDVVLDGSDTEVLDQFVNATKSFIPDGLDYDVDIDILNKSFVDGQRAYETAGPAPFRMEDDFLEGTVLSATSEPSAQDSAPAEGDPASDEIPMNDQISLLEPLLEGKKIGAGTIAELTAQLVELCRTHQLFVRDIITGLFRSKFARKPLISADHAQTIFETHFIDKLAIRTTTYTTDKETGETIRQPPKYRAIKPQELKLLWKNVALYSTFNSRKEFYDAIPEWDGEKRIKTFMKKYFECDANPNFFLLLMTCLVAKFTPRNDYCPYFFDIVANSKGIGKSLLCRRLLNNKYCGFLTFAVGRRDDFYVNAYDGNNAIVVDDECTWAAPKGGVGKISYDELKTIVSAPYDKFSRKMMQPEEHKRSFIIMRTSNFVNQVYSTNERRQIIFQCGLKEQECRILDLPDSFFEQLLAEAKEYYIKHGGVYKLTEEDKLDVKETNIENYNWETRENFAILGYAQAVREDSAKWACRLKAAKFGSHSWGSYQKYCDWCDANRKPCMLARAFWRSVAALAEIPENHLTVFGDNKYEFAGGGKGRVFRIDPIVAQKEESVDDIPDIPY